MNKKNGGQGGVIINVSSLAGKILNLLISNILNVSVRMKLKKYAEQGSLGSYIK